MAHLLTAAGTTDTTLYLDDTTNLSVDGGTVMIGSEVIAFTTASDRSLIGCTRAQQGTSAATHAAGVAVTQLEAFPFAQSMGSSPSWVTVSMQMPVLSLLDPTAVPTRSQIEANAVITVNFDSSGVNQTWTLPLLQPTTARMLVVTHNSASVKTLSVNSVSITAGVGQLFMWDGTAWYAC